MLTKNEILIDFHTSKNVCVCDVVSSLKQNGCLSLLHRQYFYSNSQGKMVVFPLFFQYILTTTITTLFVPNGMQYWFEK